jgi:beta-lactam-binding protein with PASTA domain
MPSVIGMDLSRAREVISSAITDAHVTIQYDLDAAPSGMVWMQEPAAGLEITPDRQIRLGVSTGPAVTGTGMAACRQGRQGSLCSKPDRIGRSSL